MKLVAKLFLIILFVPLSLAVILIATIKLQLLDSSFWKETLKNNNVYTNLSVILKTRIDTQTEKGGGKKSDLAVLTDIITPDIVEDFISRNLDNFLGFANGKRKELLVYLPINKIPKELAPTSIGLSAEELPLTALLSKFNITIGEDLPISQIAYTGMAANYLLVGLSALSLLCLFLLFVLTDKEKKFVTPSIALTLSGLLLLATVLFGYIIRESMLTDWVKGTEPSQIILATFAPYILEEILRIWAIVGVTLLIIGIILSFLKKPSYTNSR